MAKKKRYVVMVRDKTKYSGNQRLLAWLVWFANRHNKAVGLAPIFPYTFYHLTHYWFAAADIPVANDTPVHYADAIRCNVRRPPQGSLPLLTRRVSA